MSVSPGAPRRKRHWFVASSAIVCFFTALALLLSQFYRPTTVDFKEPIQWAYTWMWTLLDLFPHPATVWALASFFKPWIEFERAHRAVSFASNALLFLFSLGLGWSLWQRHAWARKALATLCVLKIPVVLGNIAIYRQQFTYCAEGSIYPCTNLALRLLPYYGFPVAGVVVSVAAFVFLWRYGLEPPASVGSHPESRAKTPENVTASFTKPIVHRADGALTASRWIVVALSLVIAVDYSYHVWGWLPLLLPRFSGGALGIRILMPLILLAVASYGISAVQLIRRVGVFEFALVCGTTLACVLSPFLGIDAFIAGLLGWSTPFMFVLNIAIHLCVIVFAILGLWRVTREHTSSAGSLGAGLIVPLVIVLACPQAERNFKDYSTFSRFSKPTLEKKAANNRQTTAWKLVKIYGRCVFLYRQTHPGQGFPAEASAMGPGNGRENCLTTAQVTGQIEGYQAYYEAGPADSSGAVTRFHVFVLKPESTANDLGYFLDESGVSSGLTKKSSPVDAAGNPTDAQAAPDAPLRRNPLYTALPYRLRELHDCLAKIRDADPGKQFPITAEPLFDKINPYGYPCISVYDRTQSSRSDFRSNSFVLVLNSLDTWNVQVPDDPKYRLRYAVRADSSGARTGYLLTAQPAKYNEDGVGSYWIDERGSLRRTSDNRPAIESDPEVPKCEDYPGSQCLDLIPSFGPNSPGAASKLVP